MTTTTTTTTTMKTYPIYESPKKEANEKRYGLTSKSCVCCGKPTAEKLSIHCTTDWVAVNEPNQDLVPNSQGAFPIGSECAKRFPKEFIFK
jgi:hypothetical protein